MTTMEISSRDPLPRSLSWPGSLQVSQAESTSQEEGEDTPRITTTQFVFADPNPSTSDRSPSWLQAKTVPPPPLVSSSTSVISALISSQPQLKTTIQQHQQASAKATVQGESILTSAATAVGAAQLPINAPFIYQLAAPAHQPLGGIRQSVLTPILTLLPNVQSLVANRQVGAAIPQPVILSPPAQALTMPLLSSPTSSLMSSIARATNGAQHQKSTFEQGFCLPQTRILSTEPTTGQQTLKSPVIESAVTPSTSRNDSPPRTLASIPPSEMTPQYSELKAFAEEFKNKRIRLGYTQGAVGQSLADKGYSNFAQSTISRFEQMQLSPTNAAAIKLVLEKWLQEAENPDSAHSSSSSSPMMTSRKRKRRAVFTPQTKTTLENYFKQNPRPNRQIIESVAHELELLPEEVRVWFCNKRQKEKQGPGNIPVTYKYPCERESSVSLSSSGANSPSSLYDSSTCLKRNTPSPPRNSTPFTIEELSKSSSTGTRTISSPMCFANPFTASPGGVAVAFTTPRISLAAQPSPPRVVLPQFQVAQTTA